MPKDDHYQGRRTEPMFNAPAVVIVVVIAIVALHGLTYFLADKENTRLIYDYAVVPRRFFAPPGSEYAYPNMLAAGLTLVSTAFLHTGWLHVLVNAGMLLAFGAQVARILGPGWRAGGLWLLMFLVSTAAGSAVYLAMAGPDGGAAVGASGGVSGLIGAAFLVGFDGRGRSLISRSFLLMTAAFIGSNALLAFAGPSLVGGGIAWQAHLGGYVAGAVLMLLLLPRPMAPEEAV